MKLNHLLTAAAACALIGGAAYAQTGAQPGTDAPQPGSRTGDWNGAHAPTDGSPASERVQPSTTTTSVTTSSSATTSAPMPADTSATASTSTTPAAGSYATGASVTTTLVTNGPVPDTAENRAKYGQPMSRAGKRTAARGN
ncbi:hypothetical protein [Phenylobacterium sp.]|jgi:hypothetical protein|uniref:hypothetical protein n=1 Tax=Phenylobacterium sp. TaxID=1871053 RepID=UPI002F93693B